MKPKSDTRQSHVFYDVHMHAFNLSHAGILTFLNRILKNNLLSFEDLLKGNYFKMVRRLLFRGYTGKLVSIILILLLGTGAWIGARFISPDMKPGMNTFPWYYFLFFSLGILIILILITGVLYLGNIIFRKKLSGKTRAVVNTLSVFENDDGRQFRYAELDFLSLNKKFYEKTRTFRDDEEPEVIRRELQSVFDELSIDPSFTIDKEVYNKVILTPLVMDFGYKGFTKANLDDIHYNMRPRKQVIDQTFDLFNGIKDYYNNRHLFHIFEIYPFLGINTKLYGADDEVERVLNSKFRNYIEKRNTDPTNGRYNILNELRQEFIKSSTGENRTIIDRRFFYFAGIKLYPPLSYDPWPEDILERKKAKVVYDFCIKHKIPITTHCNDGGFRIETPENIKKFTSPDQWKKVLVQEKYEKLKINFAHFGGDIIDKKHQEDWYEKVAELASDFNNVYTDFACLAMKLNEYRKLGRGIKKLVKDFPGLENKILFGSDFPMCLLFGSDSYLHYLKNFRDTRHLKHKGKFCSINPEQFLFG